MASAGSRWRAGPGDRGSSAVELAVLAPALMLLSMLIVQFGLWFNAREAALAAAQAGAMVARRDAATDPGWASAAAQQAASSYRELDAHLLGKLRARAYGDPRASVYVTVSGPLGYSVVPFPGLRLSVSATAGGPVECFRPAQRPGTC